MYTLLFSGHMWQNAQDAHYCHSNTILQKLYPFVIKPILPIERELICDVETDVEDDGDNVDKYCEDMKLWNDLFSKISRKH